MGTHTGSRERRIKASRTRRRDRYWGLMKVPRLGSPSEHRRRANPIRIVFFFLSFFRSLSLSLFFRSLLSPAPLIPSPRRVRFLFPLASFSFSVSPRRNARFFLLSFPFFFFSSPRTYPSRLNRVLNIAPSRPRTAATAEAASVAELFMTTLEIHIHPWHSSRIRPRFGSYRPRRAAQIMQNISPLLIRSTARFFDFTSSDGRYRFASESEGYTGKSCARRKSRGS